MKPTIPWILIAMFISLSLFYYYSQKAKIKKEDRRVDRKEKHKEYLESLLKSTKNELPKENETSSSHLDDKR